MSILDLLNFDPLHEAEQLTGGSCHTDELTQSLGLAAAIGHNQKKQEYLRSIGDTHFGTTAEEFRHMLERYGFEKVFSEDFIGREDRPETLYVYWLKGIAVVWETFATFRVNISLVYYNWGKSSSSNLSPYMSSGSYYKHADGDYTMCGYFDGREGMFSRLSEMAFISPFREHWLKDPMFSINCYMDYDEPRSWEHTLQLSQSRIEKLPQEIREAVSCK